MAINNGYLQDGSSNVDSTSIADAASTDGDSLGEWQRASLFLRYSHAQGAASDVKLDIEVSPDGTDWFRYRTVTDVDLADSTDGETVVPLGSNGSVSQAAYFEYVRLTNVSGFSVTLTAEYNTST